MGKEPGSGDTQRDIDESMRRSGVDKVVKEQAAMLRKMKAEAQEGGIMTSENLETQVKALLERYASDLVMLDLLWLWAKYGFGDDEAAIRSNIAQRYVLTQAQAAEAFKKCYEDCTLLLQSRSTDDVRQAMRTVLSSSFEPKIREHVSLKASGVSLAAKCSIALVNWLRTQGIQDYTMDSLFGGAAISAVLRATIGGLPGTSVGTIQEIRDELIQCGVLNKWVSVNKKGDRTEFYRYGPLIPPFTLQEVVPAQTAGSWESYISALFESNMLEQARIVEEIATSRDNEMPGVAQYFYSSPRGVLSENILPSRGLIGFAEEYKYDTNYTYAAVNPLFRESILGRLVEIKVQRSAASADAFAGAVRSLRDELWPKGELTTLKDQPDRKIWRLDQIGVSSLFIYFGNWLSESDLGSLRELGADTNRDNFLIVLTDQSLPSLKAVIGNSLKMWEKPSIAVVILKDNKITSYQLQKEAHPSVSRILEILGNKESPPPPPSLVVTLTITPTSVLIGSEVTAKVQVRDDHDSLVQGAQVVLSWGDAKANTTGESDRQGVYSAYHSYDSAGAYKVSLDARKTGVGSAVAEKRITVSSKTRERGTGGGTGIQSARERLLACFAADYAVKPPDQAWLSSLASALQSILDELGVPCAVNAKDFEWGPRVVRANVQLSKGRRIREVVAASPDIANKLFARRDLFQFRSDDEAPKNVRVESVPPKAMVGIYIPRNDFVAVPIGGLLRALPEGNPRSFVVGLNTIGQPQFSNLNSMPHLLVAGQPGAGKSVFLNSMIVSLALQNEPSRLSFVLIDPKGGLEFGPYQKLPHVVQIATNAEEALEALTSARKEMDNRYDKMTTASQGGNLVRDIDEFNALPGASSLPYRAILVDEFADLVLSDHRKQIIELVQAIAQKGRAAGIYMVICTQQPRVNVIPGGIKAVIPSRLSFRLPAGIDSKVILDESGAEDLLRGGDMFLKEPTHTGLRRFQGPMVTNEEITKFVGVTRQIWGSGV